MISFILGAITGSFLTVVTLVIFSINRGEEQQLREPYDPVYEDNVPAQGEEQ